MKKICLLILAISISCSGVDSAKSESTDSVASVAAHQDANEDLYYHSPASKAVVLDTVKINHDQLLDSLIRIVMVDMDSGHDLSNKDYHIMMDYMMNSMSQDISEGFGYSLFNYLKGNRSRNDMFLKFIDGESAIEKEKVLKRVVLLLYIDLSENEYRYNRLVADFSMLKGSDSAKVEFYRLIEINKQH